MRKHFFILAMGLLVAMQLSAKKLVVYVEEFKGPASLDQARVEQVRNAVISSLITYQHVQVIDVASEASLMKENSRRSSENALDDETARIGKMKQLGADFVLQGYVNNLLTEQVVSNKGKITYSTTLSYTIKVVNCEDGLLESTDLFTYENKGNQTAEKGVVKLLSKVPGSVKEVVTKDFKLSSFILDTDFEAQNEKLVKCYINIGEDDGVVVNTVFAVKQAIIKAGRVSWTEIGQIVVESVVAGDLSLCVVKKGGDAIYKALTEVINIKESDPNNAHDVIVESKDFKIKK